MGDKNNLRRKIPTPKPSKHFKPQGMIERKNQGEMKTMRKDKLYKLE